jgi:hypothetical protein
VPVDVSVNHPAHLKPVQSAVLAVEDGNENRWLGQDARAVYILVGSISGAADSKQSTHFHLVVEGHGTAKNPGGNVK